MAFHAQSLLVSKVVPPYFRFHREINAISTVYFDMTFCNTGNGFDKIESRNW